MPNSRNNEVIKTVQCSAKGNVDNTEYLCYCQFAFGNKKFNKLSRLYQCSLEIILCGIFKLRYSECHTGCLFEWACVKCRLCLLQVHKIIGFVPALLQLVMSEQLDMPVRQAGLLSCSVLKKNICGSTT